MKDKSNKLNDKKTHAPGAGSDKHHPESPVDANERFQNTKKGNLPKDTRDTSKSKNQ